VKAEKLTRQPASQSRLAFSPYRLPHTAKSLAAEPCLSHGTLPKSGGAAGALGAL
jgi:hypothetical protein